MNASKNGQKREHVEETKFATNKCVAQDNPQQIRNKFLDQE